MKKTGRKYVTMKFRNFCSRDREGFALFSSEKLEEVVLEDILFQLFQGLYPGILCPQIYYFTNGQEPVTYDKLHEVEGFIYVHFLQRVQKYKQEGRIDHKIKLCNLDDISRGIGINGCRLFIFSEKQYAVYSNSKYCEIVRERISDINHAYDRVVSSSGELSSMLEQVMLQKKEDDEMDRLKAEMTNLSEHTFVIDKIEFELTRAQMELDEILKSTGISLYSLGNLKGV